MSRSDKQRVSIAEALGLLPLSRIVRGIALTLGGDPSVPASRVGASVLRFFRPRRALSLRRGKTPFPLQAVITDLFNRRQTPPRPGVVDVATCPSANPAWTRGAGRRPMSDARFSACRCRPRRTAVRSPQIKPKEVKHESFSA